MFLQEYDVHRHPSHLPAQFLRPQYHLTLTPTSNSPCPPISPCPWSKPLSLFMWALLDPHDSSLPLGPPQTSLLHKLDHFAPLLKTFPLLLEFRPNLLKTPTSSSAISWPTSQPHSHHPPLCCGTPATLAFTQTLHHRTFACAVPSVWIIFSPFLPWLLPIYSSSLSQRRHPDLCD